jgi:hypothetical protein
MKRVYLAHPFGGSAFNKAEAARIEAGINAEKSGEFEIFNPIRELEQYANYSERTVLKLCKSILKSCDLLILCPGWERSRGCRYERMIAKRKGIPRIYLNQEDVALFLSLAPRFMVGGAA